MYQFVIFSLQKQFFIFDRLPINSLEFVTLDVSFYLQTVPGCACNKPTSEVNLDLLKEKKMPKVETEIFTSQNKTQKQYFISNNLMRLIFRLLSTLKKEEKASKQDNIHYITSYTRP